MALPEQPLVSVITPCYNYGRFLEETVRSLQAQTYPQWECIVVDDGSTDNTLEVAHRLASEDPRIRYLRQDNAGVSAARNRALTEVRGTFLQFLDADDLLQPRKLELHLPVAQTTPGVAVVYGTMYRFQTDDPARTPEPLRLPPPRSGGAEEIAPGLLEDNMFLPGCALVRTEAVRSAGGFKAGLRGVEDWHLMWRILLAGGRFQYSPLPETALLSRHHGANASMNSRMMLHSSIEVREDLMGFIEASSLTPALKKALVSGHRRILLRERSRYERDFGSFPKGLLLHALFRLHPKPRF